MFRRTFLKAAAVAVLLPALNWTGPRDGLLEAMRRMWSSVRFVPPSGGTEYQRLVAAKRGQYWQETYERLERQLWSDVASC